MGRPAASDANRRFAVSFANLLTRRTDYHSTIARCGTCSLYDLLKSARPAIARDANTGPRDGISEAEFNKALQVNIQVVTFRSKQRDPKLWAVFYIQIIFLFKIGKCNRRRRVSCECAIGVLVRQIASGIHLARGSTSSGIFIFSYRIKQSHKPPYLKTKVCNSYGVLTDSVCCRARH